MRRRAWAIAVPSGRPTGKTSARIGGSDSDQGDGRVRRRQIQETSSTSMTRKAAAAGTGVRSGGGGATSGCGWTSVTGISGGHPR